VKRLCRVEMEVKWFRRVFSICIKQSSGKIGGVLPENSAVMIYIKKTANVKELAEIYSAADVFVNPTYEDNYPTVNLEAQACGTRVVTYDTGGCRETVYDLESKVIFQNELKEILIYI